MGRDYLKLAVVSVMRTMGKSMDENSFVNYFSYKKNWLPPDYARKLFKICVEAGLLKKEGDKYVPNFEFHDVIPLDFEITPQIVDKYTPTENVFTQILDRICDTMKIERKEALMDVNYVKNDLKYVTIEVAALIYCKEKRIPCEDFYGAVERRLMQNEEV